MGIGAIIILAVLGTITFARANRWLEENEGLTAAFVAIMFAIDIAVLVAGNSWIWLAWALAGAAKMIWLPSEDIAARRETMPIAVHHFNIAVSVAFSGVIFALFQWLR
jgi:hypothetical protein